MDTIKVSIVIFFLSTSNNVENIQKRTLYFEKERRKEGRREKRKQREKATQDLPLGGHEVRGSPLSDVLSVALLPPLFIPYSAFQNSSP